ncbi:MAG: aldolase/citrate lyase family protein [Thermomicrobiales bacterium]
MVNGNPVREKMARGEVVLGCFVQTPTPQMVEILALTGFDFALIDAEHSALAPETVYPMILAAEARGISPVVRVGELDPKVILKYVDLGAEGIMAPQIDTPEQADMAIAATKFLPRGNRGLAGGRIFDFGMKDSAPAMAAGLSDRVLTIIQFEHVDTLNQLDAILDTPDLDVLFVGPNDLAQSLDLHGQPAHPEVAKVADEVVARCRAKGIKTGTTFLNVLHAQETVDRGFDMLVCNSMAMFANAARAIGDGVGPFLRRTA